MPIVFIALQCCECSTMQVQQQKKSSHRWSCVVCNQKQSVRKVFAQGSMAKDLRKFVQSFNMSRKSADETLAPPLCEVNQCSIDVKSKRRDWTADETLAPPLCEGNQCSIDMKSKRRDWTEFLDLEEDCKDENGEENATEMEILTELPREMFKKPKLRNYSARLNTREGDEHFKPVFSKRNGNKHMTLGDKEEGKCQMTMAMATSKSTLPGTSKGVSRWDHYITEVDDGLQLGENEGQVVWEIMTNDQKVDENIHPDFI